MKKDSSISTVDDNYLKNVKNLVKHIKSLEEQIKELEKTLQDKENEKQTFNSTWQKKCNHPEFFKITIPEEKMPSAESYRDSEYYDLMKIQIRWRLLNGQINPHPEMIFCRCSVCGLEIHEIASIEFIKELEIKNIRDYHNIDLKPISDFAKNLYCKRIEEFTSLEREIKDLNLKYEKSQEEFEKLQKEAEKIAEILNSELGICHIKYIDHYPFVDPIYSDRHYKD